VTAATPAQLRALAGETGIDALASGRPSATALEQLRGWSRSREKRAAMMRLGDAGIAAGAVLKVGELFADPHLVARGFFETVAHQVVADGPHPGAGFRIAGTAVGTHRPAPLFDGSTDEILATVLGKSAAEIAALRARGVIGGSPAGSPLPS